MILIAGSLAGVIGMLLAIPLYTVLRVFAKEFFSQISLVRKVTERFEAMSVWIEGEVMHGRQLGRELGFPTANMEVADADTIESGVYESYVEIDGVEYKAMSNLGSNPRWAEVPDISKPIFSTFRAISTVGDSGSSLRRKIRDERKFDSLEELQRQIERDRNVF